jgi:hypothetical protein
LFNPSSVVEDAANLARWEPWVRAAVYDFELLSHMHFTKHDAWYVGGTITAQQTSDCFTLWHWDATSAASMPTTLPTSPEVGSSLTAAGCGIASFIRPNDTIFKSQLDIMEGYADLREDRMSEILAQLGPPIAFWSSVVHLHPDHKKWTIELLDVALRLANMAEMRVKHAMACRRPIDYSPQIQPIILTPGHATLPSGHATEAHLIARLLIELLENTSSGQAELRDQLMRQAARIAVNRTVAGVHFPVDSAAGEMLGLKLAEYFIARCRNPDEGVTGVVPWRFVGERYVATDDFDFRALYDTTTGNLVVGAFVDPLPQVTIIGSKILNWLWQRALEEWT